MPYAITLRLDDTAAAPIVGLWQRLAEAGLSRMTAELGYAPHLTLAICPDTADEWRLRDVVATLALQQHPLPVTFPSLGVFPGRPAVLILAPVVTPDLLAIQRGLLDMLPSGEVDRHYQPGHWVPHLTLADDLADAASAVAAVSMPSPPISGVLDRIDLVHFRPVDIRATLRLRR